VIKRLRRRYMEICLGPATRIIDRGGEVRHMARNIEIKARAGELDEVERSARTIATNGPQDIEQEDVFFDVPEGRLKLRIFPDNTGELIFYRRSDAAGPKLSDYSIYATSDAAGLRALLSTAYGVRGIVKKRRRLYMSGRTRIHLDRVEELGNFVE